MSEKAHLIPAPLMMAIVRVLQDLPHIQVAEIFQDLSQTQIVDVKREEPSGQTVNGDMDEG